MATQNQIQAVINEFPVTFALKNFPKETFRISPAFSYSVGPDIMLFVEAKRGDEWQCFVRSTPAVLHKFIDNK